MFTSDWGCFDPHSSWTALFLLTISICKLFSQLHCFLPVCSVFAAALWPAPSEQWAKKLPWIGSMWRKSTLKASFLYLRTKGVLTIYFCSRYHHPYMLNQRKRHILMFHDTFSLSVLEAWWVLMTVHFQLFKHVSKQCLIWSSPYSPCYLTVFLCTCQYPVSWCHCKLCTVPCTHSAIHAHQPCPPYSFNLLSTQINDVSSDSRARQ